MPEDFDAEMKKREAEIEKTFTLPDGKEIQVGTQVYLNVNWKLIPVEI